jgi:hypothetical protein
MSEHVDQTADMDANRVLEHLKKIAAARRGRSPAPHPSGGGFVEGTPESLVVGPRHSGRTLGALLVPRGFLTGDELQHVLSLQRRSGERLGEIVVRLGLISDSDLVELLAEQLRMPTIDLDRVTIDWAVARLISKTEARTFGILPVRRDNDHIDVAIADPTDKRAPDFLARQLDAPIRLYLATRAAIDAAVDGLTDQPASV